MAHIVIVDDDELICAIVASALAAAGHIVVPVRDGDDALDALWESGPNLAILDCALPGKTGLTILREIRQSAMFRDLPVLMLTARRSEWHAKLAMDSGANDYMRKPFDTPMLIAKVDQLLADAVTMRPGETLLDAGRLADLRATIGVDQADTLLAMMEQDIAERSGTIARMLEASDHTGARQQAHALRGAADGIGALDLARHCHAIEHDDRGDGADVAACATLTIAAIRQARAGRPNA